MGYTLMCRVVLHVGILVVMVLVVSIYRDGNQRAQYGQHTDIGY